MSEEDAVAYLSNNSNYFRLSSYKRNFLTVDHGPRQGQYRNLDFKMLVDLSIVDMLLRQMLLCITLDVEHFAKMKLLRCLEERNEDGYQLVDSFIESYSKDNNGKVTNSLKDEIDKCNASPYTGWILGEYPKYDFPIWAFLEVISLGSFNHFYKYCADHFNDRAMKDDFYLLQSVKMLRNACAHNDCILSMLKTGNASFAPRNQVQTAVSHIPKIGKTQRDSKLKNECFQQIATALYMHKELVSVGIRSHRAEDLRRFVARMNKNAVYYKGNEQVLSGFAFIEALVEAWYPRNICADEDSGVN